MECEKCGAALSGETDVCPECGEPVRVREAAPGGDLAPLEETVVKDDTGSESFVGDEHDAHAGGSDEAPLIDESETAWPGDESVEPAEPGEPGGPADEAADEGAPRRPWLIPALIGVVVLAVLGLAAYYLFGLGGVDTLTGNEPGSAAIRMLQAYANYDAQGILDNATHGNLPASGIADFKNQAAEAKKRANGKPGVKDLKVLKVTIDPKDPNKATVQVRGSWLLDPAKGTYQPRTEELQMVKQNGKWKVKLFV